MWFGNMVTPTWWDDLWLNESFANWISFVCMDEAKGLEKYINSWALFMIAGPVRGIDIDLKPTTHPIYCDVADTDVAREIFDGISYGKGGAWLRQTFFLYGMEVFNKGIVSYFTEFAYKNSTLDDFLRHFDAAAKELKVEGDFLPWAESWLKNAGANEIWHDIEEEDGKIKKFTVQQRVCKHGEGNRLRIQKYQVAFYDKDMKVTAVHSITTKDD